MDKNMNSTEQTYLTELVEKALDSIEYTGALLIDAETAQFLDQRSGQPVRKYSFFRQSELYKIANDELHSYVRSEKFKESFFRQYIEQEQAAGNEFVPLFPLDGSKSFGIQDAREVDNYLAEVGRIGHLYESHEQLREWFSQQFLQSLNDRNYYVRHAYRTMLHFNRPISFDDALGFEIESVLNPQSIQDKAVQQLKSTVGGDIQNKMLYDSFIERATASQEFALFFSHPVIQFLAYQAVTHPPISVHGVRLQDFIESLDVGVIRAFELTPYPLLDTFNPQQHERYRRAREIFSPLQESFGLQVKEVPELSFAQPDTPEKRLYNCTLLEAHGARKCMRWIVEEKILFGKKVVNHKFNDPKAADKFNDSGFQYPEYWPEIIELLQGKQQSFLDVLGEEIKTKIPQRLEDHLKDRRDLTPDRLRFASEIFPSKMIEVAGQQYQLEIDRSLISVMNIMGNREDRDQTWDGEAIPSLVGALADFDNQFISVHKMESSIRYPEHIGSVWLDGSTRLGGERLDYYDEIPQIGVDFSPLRPELLKYATEFALHCGYKLVEFDSNDLITPADEKAL